VLAAFAPVFGLWPQASPLLSRVLCPFGVQAADLEAGARQLLDQLDDLSVDVPKAPVQVRVEQHTGLGGWGRANGTEVVWPIRECGRCSTQPNECFRRPGWQKEFCLGSWELGPDLAAQALTHLGAAAEAPWLFEAVCCWLCTRWEFNSST